MNSEASLAAGPTSRATRGLADSIRRLAALYRIEAGELEILLSHLFLDAYAEVILLREGMEIVVGGVGISDRLIALARKLDVAEATIRLFTKFSSRFPDRIGYLKIALGPGAAAATMHCGAMTRWSEISRFTAEEAEFAAAAPSVAALRDPDSICNLIAFTTLAGSDSPMMKVYWLLDQSGGGRRSPMLAAGRIAQGRMRPESKLYHMGADWADARIDARWNRLVDAASAEFPEDAFLCVSKLLRDGAVVETKLYMFVQDSRIAARDRPTSLNLYYPEGLQYLYWGDFARACNAFSNAFAFEPTHAHALNNRGYCRMQMGDIAGALADFEQALRLDPTLSPANRDFARASLISGPAAAP